MRIRLAAALVAVLVVAGCDALFPPGGDAGPIDGEWRLTGGSHDGLPLPIPPEAPISLVVDGDEVGGRAACNQYGGEVTLDGDDVTFGAMSMTEMGCDPAIMDAESAYLAALADVERWVRDGATLRLIGNEVELTYELVPPAPDAALVGTRWRLDGLVDGDAVSSTMGDPATLELREDGTLTGTTGCRTFDGRYELDGNAVRVTDLANDDRACPGLETQDEHVLAVLAEGFIHAVQGEQLTLTAGRIGLVYLAETE
ncbi:MAG TPA: META domain-containing protein [Candidatus Angelobacter sp.]|nr:META domain-containing protein [Candidatus Angelobacter sp.]